MSERARHVLALIDAAERTRQHNPTLFSAQLHANGRDRDVRQLATAVERKKLEKPTVHARPFRDEVEPIDVRTAERYARTSEEHDRGRRLRLAADRRSRRTRLGGLELIRREVLPEMGRISTVRAGNMEPSRGGESPGGVPEQQMIQDDPRWRLAEAQLRRHALVLCELIDEARGFGHAQAASALSAEEKDKAIEDEGVGLVAAEVFFRLGPEYGSESYVRKLRRRRGLDGRGYPKAES